MLTSDPYSFQSMVQSSPFETHSDTYQKTSLVLRREFATEELRKVMDKKGGAEGRAREPIWSTHKSVWDKAKAAWSGSEASLKAPRPPAPAFHDDEDAGGGSAGNGSQTRSLAMSMTKAEKAAQERGKSVAIPWFVSESAAHSGQGQGRYAVREFSACLLLVSNPGRCQDQGEAGEGPDSAGSCEGERRRQEGFRHRGGGLRLRRRARPWKTCFEMYCREFR